MVTGQAPVPVHASGFSIDRRGAVRRIARVHLEREVSETVFFGPSADWWQADFGQEPLEGRDGMQIVEGRVRRYIDGLVGGPVIAGLQVLKCLLRVSQTRIRFS
jgi:hypothetical protein